MKISFQQLMRFRKADEGQAIVFVALGLMTLLMAAGLGVDVGYLHYQKEQMQKAADAGALAGASALVYSTDANAKLAAKNDTQANNFQDQTNGVTVTVNIPPATSGDPYGSDPNAVEVIVAQARPIFFMKVLGVGTVNVSARAVAARNSSTQCMITLDPSTPKNGNTASFQIDGTDQVTSSCGVAINSADPNNALSISGSSGLLDVTGNGNGIGINGGYSCSGHGGSCSNITPTPTTGIGTVKDPLAGYAAPTYNAGSCDIQGNMVTGGTIGPANGGIYVICGNVSLTGNGSLNFLPGTYILQGGLSVDSNFTVTGTGVTFYATTDPTQPASKNYSGISMQGGSTSYLTAPTTGTYAGILFFQDRSISDTKQHEALVSGNSGAKYTGALYFPSTLLQFSGTPNAHVVDAIIVAYDLEFNGNASLSNAGLTNVGSPAQSAVLVE